MNTPNPRAQHAQQPAPDVASLNRAAQRGELVRQPHAVPPSPAAVPDERRILAVAGMARRVGRWTVPRLLRVRAFGGNVKIDLRENAIPPNFTLDVKAYGSSVTLIVPPDIDVAFDVFALMGNAISQAHEPPQNAGARVTGSAVLGEVRVLVRPR